jgi:hypothetical protein
MGPHVDMTVRQTGTSDCRDHRYARLRGRRLIELRPDPSFALTKQRRLQLYTGRR